MNRLSHAMHLALEAFTQHEGESAGAAIARVAQVHGVSASGMYRALISAGRISKRERKARKRK